VAKLFEKQLKNLYYNWLSFIEDFWKVFWCVFLWGTVYIHTYMQNWSLLFSPWWSSIGFNRASLPGSAICCPPYWSLFPNMPRFLLLCMMSCTRCTVSHRILLIIINLRLMHKQITTDTSAIVSGVNLVWNLGVVDPNQTHFDVSRQISRKCRLFQAI